MQLIEECEAVPPAVVEALVDALYDGPSGACDLAASVCRATQDHLQKHTAHYFCTMLQESEGDRGELERVHKHIKCVSAVVPSTLMSVVPLLEEELHDAATNVRHLATTTLGSMFAHVPAKGSERLSRGLASMYPTTWQAWLERASDRNVPIRLAWVSSAQDVLMQYAELAQSLAPALSARLMDPDERVRGAIAHMLGSLDYETLRHSIPSHLMRELAGRGKDRRTAVREEALRALGRAYDLACPAMLGNDDGAIGAFAWIPSAIMSCCLTGAAEVTHAVAQILDTYILPAPESPAGMDAWTDRLLMVVASMSGDALAGFYSLTNLRIIRPSVFDKFLAESAQIRSTPDDEIPSRSRQILRACAAALGNAPKTSADLVSISQHLSGSELRSLKACFDCNTPLWTSAQLRAEVVASISKSDESLTETMAMFLRAGSYPILNTSVVPSLVRNARSDVAKSVLWYIGKQAPQLLVPNASFIVSQSVATSSAQAPELELLARLAAYSADSVEIDPAFAMQLCRSACGSSSSKNATKILACLTPHNDAARASLQDVVDTVHARLVASEADEQVAALCALVQVLKNAPDAIEHDTADTLTEVALQHVILAPWNAPMGHDRDWVADAEVPPELEARTTALKVLTRRCIAAASHEGQAALLIKPLLKLLWVVLDKGEAHADLGTPAWAASRMRLQAALCIFKLAQNPVFEPLIVTRNVRLAYALQDECFHVRREVLHYLLTQLTRHTLSPLFHTLAYIVALDPESEPRAMVAAYTRRNAVAMSPELRRETFEAGFLRFLHLLAHHPDLNVDEPAEVIVFAKYIDFFLACNATESNIALFEHLAATLKTTRDKLEPATTDQLHLIAELAELVVRWYADGMGWTLNAWHGNVALPEDIVTALPPAEAQKARNRHHLDAQTTELLSKQRQVSTRQEWAETDVQKRSSHTKDAPQKRRKAVDAHA